MPKCSVNLEILQLYSGLYDVPYVSGYAGDP